MPGAGRLKCHRVSGPAIAAKKFMASRNNPFVFLQQVRQETAKVTWPTRRETLISSIMVVIFAIIASIFFLAADQLIAWLISLVYNFGG
jgi:preprotein translocase subunit SecE